MLSYRAVLVMLLCAALVALGLVMVVRYGAWPDGPRAPLRRWPLGYAALVVVPGVLAAGAGGRLVMRLLAVTSPDAHGQITEAGETIGEITFEGSAGFILFNGLAAGFLAAVLYVLVAEALPRGRAGGAILGLLLLVLVGASVEPLRADNFDFNLVGPPWLSLLSFTALAVFQGMVTWALAARLRLPGLRLGKPIYAQVAAGIVVLIALPGFISAIADIVA